MKNSSAIYNVSQKVAAPMNYVFRSKVPVQPPCQSSHFCCHNSHGLKFFLEKYSFHERILIFSISGNAECFKSICETIVLLQILYEPIVHWGNKGHASVALLPVLSIVSKAIKLHQFIQVLVILYYQSFFFERKNS